MTLLAFDTACDACSVAVWRAGGIAAHGAKAMMRGQSEELVVMIESVMAQAGQSFATLAAVAVTVGPGAFTGLRIGLATARAIALATDRPAIGVSTFEAIAAAARAEGDNPARAERDNPARAIVVAIDTKRGDLYLQSFRRDDSELGFAPCHDAMVLAPAAAVASLPSGPLLLAGDGAAALFEALGGGGARAALAQASLPDAGHVAAIAALRLAAGVPLPPLRPLYMRPPEVRLPSPASAGVSP